MVRAVLPHAPERWHSHDQLIVGEPGGEVEVDWWVEDGAVHAATVDGLARALAQAAGAWPRRLLLAAVLAEPDRAADLLSEAELEGD